MTDTGVLILVFALGAVAGSFLNVCVVRWPAGLSVVSPRSRCPHCERPVRATENIPILGWILLRGRCRGCDGAISLRYPLVELAVALAWVGAFAWYGVGFTAVRVAVLVTILAGVALTDAEHYVIPDGFTISGLVWVLATAIAGAFMHEPTPFAGPYDALVGACAGAGAIAIAGWIGEAVFGREAMGFGDVTLMAVVGCAVGPERAFMTIFIASALGVVVFLGAVAPIVRLRHGPRAALPQVPFGVFLAPAAAIALVAGEPLLQWYFRTIVGG